MRKNKKREQRKKIKKVQRGTELERIHIERTEREFADIR